MAKKGSFTENKKIIKSLPKNKREIAEKLLEKIEFMETELGNLQAILKEKGWTEEYQNGPNQYGIKKSAEAEVYNNLIKNYNATIKALIDIVPDAFDPSNEIEKEFFR